MSRRIDLLLCGLFAAATITGAAAAPLPAELANIAQLAENEQRLARTVRDYDLLQQWLCDWDIALAQQHSAAGDEALANGKFENAQHRIALTRRAYEEALRYYPNNGRLLTHYGGLLYYRQFDKAGALRAWKLAEATSPKLAAPLNEMGIHYCHAGQYGTGLRYFDKLMALEPNNPVYLFNVAQIYLIHFPQVQKHYGWDKQKVYRTAMKWSKKAARLAPDDFEILQDYAVNFFAGDINFDVEVNWREAAQAWQKARPHAPDQTKRFFTWLNEARAWIKAGEKQRAAACLRNALEIHPDSKPARRLLAETEGQPEPAKDATP